MPTDPPEAVKRLASRLYGAPIVRNSARGELVEEIVAMALEPEWRLCGDWSECDLKHRSGLRLQVKQSAARQSWYTTGSVPSRGSFRMAYKTGRYLEDGNTWVNERSRNADIFVFAWHPGLDETSDHRSPEQWRFFVIAERDLPPRASISLSTLRTIADEVAFAVLADAVEAVAASCK
jgi:hypothetical protein